MDELEREIRRRTEELQARNQALERARQTADEANRLKSEFLANTSHELRTPLNAIMGFLRLIQDGLCDSREEEHEFVRQAYTSSQHLLNLINDILDLAKIESGNLSTEMKPVGLRALFDEVRTLTHVQASQKGLALTFEIDDGSAESPPELMVRADESRLKQVLLNVVGNALKFTTRGDVAVRAQSHPEKGHVAVVVRDTGVGIAPENQAKLFRPFVQADGSTTRKFGGTGLGLAISRKLMELMGGTLTLFSEGEGKGTTLTATVPLCPTDLPAEIGLLALSTDRTPVEESGARALALVVDDDAVVRALLERMLAKRGYRVRGAETADQALAALALETPALITLDIGLPSSSRAQLRTGWDLLRVISEWVEDHAGDPRPTVLIVTGYDHEVHRRLAQERFFCNPVVLAKPFTEEELRAVVPPVVSPALRPSTQIPT